MHLSFNDVFVCLHILYQEYMYISVDMLTNTEDKLAYMRINIRLSAVIV